MGKIIKDSSGKVLLSSSGAYEVTAAIDSNIVAGNIKKDVDILGVIGTYEGSGGGSWQVTVEIDNTSGEGSEWWDAVETAVNSNKDVVLQYTVVRPTVNCRLVFYDGYSYVFFGYDYPQGSLIYIEVQEFGYSVNEIVL